MSITDLPSELLIQTFIYLDRVDLKSVRGVCRLFANTASPTLFQRVLVAPRYQALGAFQNISQHPIYQTYVKEIVYDGSVYDRDLATNENVYMNHLAADVCTTYRLDSCGRRKRWKQYQQLYYDQEGIRKSLILLRTLERALESMPNVTTVVYSPGPRHVPAEKKEVKDILPRGEPHCARGFGSFDDFVESNQHGFHTLIGALALVNYTGIRSFRIEAPCGASELQGTIFTDYVFELSDEAQMQAGQHLFNALHSLSLPLSLTTPGASNQVSREIPTHLNTLRELLRGARELHELSLRLHKWHPNPCSMYSQTWAPDMSIVPHVLGNITWPHIRSLDLGGFHARAQELIDLVRRHDSTLHEIHYSHCAMIEGKWSDVVDSILQTARITSFQIVNVHEAVVDGERSFIHLSAAEMSEWIYSGRLQLGAGGEREFVS
jgi:hypothetical protein